MSKPTKEKARELIEEAWRRRRESSEVALDKSERPYAELRNLLSEAAAIGREINDQSVLSVALRRLGHTYLDFDQHEEARALMAQALLAANQSEDSCAIAHTIRHLGDVEFAAEQLDAAEKHYAEALALFRAQVNPPALDFANALRAMAILKEKTESRDEANQLWAEARPLYSMAGIEGDLEAT
ncbi:MAG: tetratricopeptide repeat protein, partial [Verrucomicrobiota bacterium]